MRKRIKGTGFSDWDTMFYNNLLSIPVLAVASIIAEDWGFENLNRNLYVLIGCCVNGTLNGMSLAPLKQETSYSLRLRSLAALP